MDQSLLPHADKMYEAAQREVDAYGFVHNVCEAPEFNSLGIAPEGQAFYIQMECARTKLKESEQRDHADKMWNVEAKFYVLRME